jgi:hypothetical protein
MIIIIFIETIYYKRISARPLPKRYIQFAIICSSVMFLTTVILGLLLMLLWY